MFGNYNISSYSMGIILTMKFGEVLTVGWWIYVLIMSPSMLFTGGFEEFFLGLFAIVVLLMLPMVFYKP